MPYGKICQDIVYRKSEDLLIIPHFFMIGYIFLLHFIRNRLL